jgi:transposase
MRRLEISDVEVMRLALQQEIARSDDSRYDHRLHGVLLVSRGLSCYHVAEWLGENPRTIQRWVHNFESHGFAGLQEGERSGRPRRLGEKQLTAVGRDLRRHPRQFGYGQNLWDGKLLAHHLAEVYEVKLGARQCQRIFHQLRFRLRKPRPVIAQADPAAQAEYKKTPSPGSRHTR